MFLYGTNWPWLAFGADFGGVAAWRQGGVRARAAEVGAAMAAMRAAGVRLVRWWMFPRLFSDALRFAPDGTPAGLDDAALEDLAAALALAAAHDLDLMLVLLSFDGFRPTGPVGDRPVAGLRPIVADPARTRALCQRVIAPLARAAAASPHRARLHSWDLMNEPEWALAGRSRHGGAGFSPADGLEAVSHGEMETFLAALAATLHAQGAAPVTLGSAAIKWARAWRRLPLDLYQVHYYDWVHEHFPYHRVTLRRAGLDDRPVVMGELPLAGVRAPGRPALSASDLAAELARHGYAGALTWAYNDPAHPWDAAAMRDGAARVGAASG